MVFRPDIPSSHRPWHNHACRLSFQSLEILLHFRIAANGDGKVAVTAPVSAKRYVNVDCPRFNPRQPVEQFVVGH